MTTQASGATQKENPTKPSYNAPPRTQQPKDEACFERGYN
jgi:hypothetical protein